MRPERKQRITPVKNSSWCFLNFKFIIMKEIILNLIYAVLLTILAIIVFLGTIEVFKLVITNYTGFWSIFLLGTGITCSILVIYYPLYYSIKDTIKAYKDYRKNRLVKILNKLNKKD